VVTWPEAQELGYARYVRIIRAALALSFLLVACGSDPDRPPASSSGGSSGTSVGGSSSGGSSSGDSGTPGTDGGSSSSGGLDAGTNIPTGLRASVDNAATEFSDGPKGVRQSNGFALALSGKDSFGNELKINLTSASSIAAGKYDCAGGVGTSYASIDYVVTGAVATWSALDPGDCSIIVIAVDNKAGGAVAGTFQGTVRRASSTERLITKGQFRLTLE